eukprot:2539592-Pleurochrysis_carterae.AAC.1
MSTPPCLIRLEALAATSGSEKEAAEKNKEQARFQASLGFFALVFGPSRVPWALRAHTEPASVSLPVLMSNACSAAESCGARRTRAVARRGEADDDDDDDEDDDDDDDSDSSEDDEVEIGKQKARVVRKPSPPSLPQRLFPFVSSARQALALPCALAANTPCSQLPARQDAASAQ